MQVLLTIQVNVQQGHKRGKRLGFPTMNAPVSRDIPEGIYISRTLFEGKTYNSLTFIGEAKTYNETAYLSETYLFDFSQDMYGETVKVQLLRKIRDNKKFATEEELIKQMEEDKRQAEEFFKNPTSV